MGATRLDLVKSVLGRGAVIAQAGISAGLVGSFWLMRLLSGLLYGVSPFDIVNFAATAALLAIALAGAALAPARRSARTDPIQSLRCE